MLLNKQTTIDLGGNSQAHTDDNVRRTLRMLIVQAFMVATIFCLVFWYLDYGFLVGAMVLCQLLYVGCFFSLRSQLIFTPRFLFFVGVNLSVFAISASLGFSSYVWTFFFPAAAVPALFSNFEKTRRRALMIGTPIFFLALLFAQHQFFSGLDLQVPQYKSEYNLAIGTFSVFAAVLAQVSQVMFFYSRQFQSKKFMEDQQAMLIQQEKMLSIGTLSAGIAHEINNSLASLRLNFDLVQRRLESTALMDEKLRVPVARISKIVDRIGGTVSSLQIYARGEAGPLEQVSLREVFEFVQGLLHSRIEVQGASLSFNSKNENSCVWCNHSHLVQVFMSLISNSLDAVPRPTGDTSSASSEEARDERRASSTGKSWIRIEVTEQGDETEIRVVDGGPGIVPALRQKIFDPFFTTKEVGQGAGLGLAIARSLITTNEGQIFYDEEAEQTTFVMKLKSAMPLDGVRDAQAV